jgi:Ran GTPase-activating protein (RanGAP) involved in mRNA processing and transport
MNALRALNLSYSNLNDDLINGLAESISQMAQLQKINLKQCGLTHASVDKILEKLTTQGIPNKLGSSIVSLNLSGNNLQGLSNMGKFLAKP